MPAEARYNRYGERIRVDGFRIFRPDEEYLYLRAGKEFLLNTLNAAFDYAYLEARFLGLKIGQERDRQAFKELCELRRALCINGVANYIDEMDRRNGNRDQIPIFCARPEEDMIQEIQEKYKLQKKIERLEDLTR